jgi:hypothetical protein
VKHGRRELSELPLLVMPHPLERRAPYGILSELLADGNLVKQMHEAPAGDGDEMYVLRYGPPSS